MIDKSTIISFGLLLAVFLYCWIVSKLHINEKTQQLAVAAVLVVFDIVLAVLAIRHPKFHIWLWLFILSIYLDTVIAILEICSKEKLRRIIKIFKKIGKAVRIVAWVIYLLYAFCIIDESFPLIGEYLFIS